MHGAGSVSRLARRALPRGNVEAVASTARGVERARGDADIAAIGHPENATNGTD